MSPDASWRPARGDVGAMLLVALIPMLLALPQLTPWLKANPAYYVAGMTVDRGPAILPGLPYIDPNSGFQTQALGYRAVMDWVSGEVPWWNPYTGIGMPLAAEYQGAAFFPLTVLVALPRGMVLLQMALHIFAGIGAYALARQLGLARAAAFAAGAMFGLNGTLAWLSHGPAGAVPWLPWILLGIERAWIAASQRRPGGWRMLAVAMAMSLLAGFPETAYLNGLFALAWAMLRGVQAPRAARAGFAIRVAAGGIIALAIAAPQIMSFFLYVRDDSHIGGHAGEYADAVLGGPAILMSLFGPYMFGPIFAYHADWPALAGSWGAIGGYASIAIVVAALYGFLVRRDALGWMLVIWIVTTLAKTFGVEPFLTLWNLVPGVTAAAFARYIQPTWELALVLLASRGIDSVSREGPLRDAWRITCHAAIGMLVAAVMFSVRFWIRLPSGQESLPLWFVASAVWGLISIAVVLALARARRATLLGALLAMESAVFCAIPVLSNPKDGSLAMPAIEFLRANIGLQRFYTLGPISPNYGALFGIASINHNYLPVPELWVQHIKAKLDSKWTDAVVFTGDPTRNSREELRANLRAYEEVGVKYVVASVYEDPLKGADGVKLAYADSIMKIFELPRPGGYFEASPGSCALEVKERRSVKATCAAASTLTRRELFYPGWTATVNGIETPITARDTLFQAIALPQGSSEVRFRYAPPHIAWAWLAAALGLFALAIPPSLLRRNHK